MRLNNCNFKTWSNNHSPDHKDRVYRELYPYKVFDKIDFDFSQINKEQVISFNNIEYYVEILKIEIQDNTKYRTTFNLNTIPKSNTQKWKQRTWKEKFQIIYSQEYDFITVYTKKEDSSKSYLKDFFKGNFDNISENKSIPVSDLLFRTLVLMLSEDLFGEGQHYDEFKYIPDGIRYLPEHPQMIRKSVNYFAPIYSKKRDLWVCHSFNEEKAHRIGFYNGNQCKELYVIYCNPTYTRHHRCKYENVQIVSLFEFAFKNSKKIYNNYDKQIRFLQNHLNKQEDYSIEKLEREIQSPSSQEYEIYKSELMEALGIMKIVPTNKNDLFYYLASMNLLNFWINRNKQQKDNKEKLFREMYFFKTYLSETVTHLVTNDNLTSKIYLEANLVMIELNNFQFSFHNVPLNDKLKNYLKSNDNKYMEWKGKKLQPISPLIFRYAKELNKSSN